jgi:3-hydroxyisobutyrate dehydrogenase-like beta-hydroxyacid dehydrogenase
MFRVADLLKDLGLAQSLYGEVGIDTPLTETTRGLFQRAAAEHGEQDIAAIAELWHQPAAARQALR